MWRILPDWLLASIIVLLGCTATLLIFLFVVLVPALLKVLIPIPAWQRWMTALLVPGVTFWAWTITRCMDLARQPRWDVQWPAGLNPRGSYLLISNHSTWLDIPVLLRIFHGHIPFPRPFIKQQLIWLPIIGFCAWALDCPFMRRHTREEIERNPALRGKDLETTRRACEKFRHIPVTVLNYAEGTRMTEAKRIARNSPYKHLLRPKSAGVAFVLNAMGDQFDAILDMTIAYTPGQRASFWDYLCGRVGHIYVRIEKLPVPVDLIDGDYQNDPEFQRRFQQWMTALWDRKDKLIDALHAQMQAV
jgi:1-acyl-sn-glycerol-3-phosphate acyltransferase